MQALERLLDCLVGAQQGPLAPVGLGDAALLQWVEGFREPTGITALSVALEQIQDAAPKQLTLFPLQDEREGKLQEVQHYLATRFGANRLRRAVLVQPGAPLPEWRVSWQDSR